MTDDDVTCQLEEARTRLIEAESRLMRVLTAVSDAVEADRAATAMSPETLRELIEAAREAQLAMELVDVVLGEIESVGSGAGGGRGGPQMGGGPDIDLEERPHDQKTEDDEDPGRSERRDPQ